MQANQPIFGGRQLGKIQNSLKYKFRENMFREKFRVFSLKKIQSKLFRVFLQNMVENHHRNRFSRKKFREKNSEKNSERNSEFSKPSKRKGGILGRAGFPACS
jgi:hypothetical protein